VQGEYCQNIARFYASNEKNAMPLLGDEDLTIAPSASTLQRNL
jgi:hypothetical protein